MQSVLCGCGQFYGKFANISQSKSYILASNSRYGVYKKYKRTSDTKSIHLGSLTINAFCSIFLFFSTDEDGNSELIQLKISTFCCWACMDFLNFLVWFEPQSQCTIITRIPNSFTNDSTGSFKNHKHMVANTFFKLSRMPWSSHSCNDYRSSYSIVDTEYIKNTNEQVIPKVFI